MSSKQSYLDIFQISEKNNKLKINNFLTSFWHINWRFINWHGKRTRLYCLTNFFFSFFSCLHFSTAQFWVLVRHARQAKKRFRDALMKCTEAPSNGLRDLAGPWNWVVKNVNKPSHQIFKWNCEKTEKTYLDINEFIPRFVQFCTDRLLHLCVELF